MSLPTLPLRQSRAVRAPKRIVAVALLSLSALWLSACQRAEPEVPAAREQTKTASAILAAFEADMKACTGLVRALATDRAFVAAFQSAEIRSTQPVDALLRKTAVANSPEVAYFLGHRKYMELGVDFHGHPWAVAWVSGEPIFCAATFERLTEIEAQGESEEAWRIRSYFLNKALESLSPPGDESPGPLVEFVQFKGYVVDAAKRYTGAQKGALHAWLEKAIKVLDESRKDIEEGAAGLTSQQQNQMLDERIAFLRQIIQTTP